MCARPAPNPKARGSRFQGFSLLSAGSARNTKPPAYELPPISRVQEMGGSSYAGGWGDWRGGFVQMLKCILTTYVKNEAYGV